MSSIQLLLNTRQLDLLIAALEYQYDWDTSLVDEEYLEIADMTADLYDLLPEERRPMVNIHDVEVPLTLRELLLLDEALEWYAELKAVGPVYDSSLTLQRKLDSYQEEIEG